MGAVVGLCFGVGAFLVISAFVTPAAGKNPSAQGRIRRMLDAAGMASTRVSTLVAACVAAGVVGLLAGAIASRTPPVAIAFGALTAWFPITYVRGRLRKRQRDFAEVWPEAVDNLASAVRAGLSLPEGLAALGVRGPAALRPAFARFGTDYEVTGRFGEALDRLKSELADPVGDQVVEALRIAREVGGSDLGRLLRSLSGWLREETRTRAELEARQAWAINGARMAVAAPWLVLLLLCFQPEVIHRYATPTGTLVLFAGAAVCVLAYRLMLRLGRLPTQVRVLS